MSKIATIKIGLLGGRKYGKTAFLTKLICLADSSEDGFIQLNAGSESLQIKNQLLLNDGVLPATSIEEVTKYDFLLGSTEGTTWNMKFCDYAGELVERIDTNTSENENQYLEASDSNNLEDTPESNDKPEQSFVANEGNRPFIKKVKKWLKSCDAFIVLVPADITNKDTYPTEEVEIFKQNIGLILKVMKEDEYLTKRPVCMAINKWDMLEQSMTLEEILKRKEYASFWNQLKNLCGANLFVKPISAFGKHLEDDTSKADPDGKPINVIEMLKELCQKAETARALIIGKKTRKTPVFLRWFWAPCLLLHNSFQGFSNGKFRKYKKLLWMKYLREFAIGSVSSAISIFVFTLCICTWILYNQYSSIRQQISKGFANKEIVEDTEKQITKKHFFDFMFMKYSLVGIDKSALRKDFFTAKNKYNADILKSCQDYYEERKGEIKDLSLDPGIRTKRADEAISFIESRIKMLTSDAMERSQLQDLVDKQIIVEKNRVDENSSFDVAYQKWQNIPETDIYTRINEAAKLLKEYTKAKFPTRKEHIASLQKQKDNYETNRYYYVFTQIHGDNYSDDFNEKTDDYLNRINRAQTRIKFIKSEIEKLPGSSKLEEYRKLIAEEEDRIEYLRQFGDFDLNVNRLLRQETIETITEIVEFIATNKATYFEKRESSFAKLTKRIDTLNDLFFSALQKKLAIPSLRDAVSLSWEQQVERANNRIVLIRSTQEKLSDEQLKKRCGTMIEEQQAFVEKRKLYGPIEKRYKDILAAPETQQLTLITSFFSDFDKAKYPEVQNYFDELNKIRQRLSEAVYADVSSRIPKRQPQAKIEIQTKIAEDTINILKDAQKKLPEGSDKWNSCERLIKAEQDFIAELRTYIPFEKAYLELQSKPDNFAIIHAIEDFLVNNTIKTYPKCQNIFDSLKQKLSEKESELYSFLVASPQLNGNWKQQIDIIKSAITSIDKNMQYFPKGSNFIAKVQDHRRLLEEQRNKISLYGPFDDEYEETVERLEIKNDEERIQLISKFFDGHPQKVYLERENELANLRKRLDDACVALFGELMKVLGDERYKDDDNLRWEIKISRAQQRTKICTEYISKFPESAKQRAEINGRIASENNLISVINNYKPYYVAYEAVEALDDNFKVKGIDDFVKQYSNQYANPIPRYTLEALLGKRKELIARFQSEYEKKIENNQDSSNESWENRLKKANVRLNALKVYEISCNIIKADEASKLQDLIKLCQNNIDFNNELLLVNKDNPNMLERFKCIYAFYKKFPAPQWMKMRSDDYAAVENLEKQLCEKIRNSLNKALKTSDTTSLAGAIKTQKDHLRQIQEHQQMLLPQQSLYSEFEALTTRTTDELNKLLNVEKTYKKIKGSLKEAQNITENSSFDDIGVFLIGVSSAIGSLSPEDVHPYIKDDYDALITIREKWNEYLYACMNKELKPFTENLKNAADEEKNILYDQILSTRKRYLSLFSPESDRFTIVKREFDNCQKSQEYAAKELKIRKAIENLNAILGDTSYDVDAKLDAIDNFEITISTCGKQDDFPIFRTEFSTINNLKKRLEMEANWRKLHASIDKLILDVPETNDEDKVNSHILECNKKLEALTPYVENEITEVARAAQSVMTKLKEHRYLVSSIRREWVLYNAVTAANSKYRAEPSDYNFDNFQQAVSEHKQYVEFQNNKHNVDVDKLVETNVKHNTLRKAMISAFGEFKNSSHYTSQNLDNFIKAAKAYIEVGGASKETNYALSFINALNVESTVRVPFYIELDTYDFRNSGFESPWGIDVDFNASVSGLTRFVEWDIEDIKGDYKNNPDHSLLAKRIGVTKISYYTGALYLNSITVEFKNYNCSNDIGSVSVPFAYILASAIDTGACTIKFSAPSNRRTNSGNGSVWLKFSGLPKLEK